MVFWPTALSLTLLGTLNGQPGARLSSRLGRAADTGSRMTSPSLFACGVSGHKTGTPVSWNTLGPTHTNPKGSEVKKVGARAPVHPNRVDSLQHGRPELSTCGRVIQYKARLRIYSTMKTASPGQIPKGRKMLQRAWMGQWADSEESAVNIRSRHTFCSDSETWRLCRPRGGSEEYM